MMQIVTNNQKIIQQFCAKMEYYFHEKRKKNTNLIPHDDAGL